MEKHLEPVLKIFHSLIAENKNPKLVIQSIVENVGYESTYIKTEGGFYVSRKEETSKSVRETSTLLIESVDMGRVQCWNPGDICGISIINK